MRKKLRKHIRKIITEQLLDEDYEGIKQVEVFADDMFKAIAEKNINTVFDWATKPPKDDYLYFFSINTNDVYKKNEGKYPKASEDEKLKMGNFLDAAKYLAVYINAENPKRKTVGGNYSPNETVNNRRYNPHTQKEINLFYNSSFKSKLRNSVLSDMKSFGKFTSSDLYFLLFLEFNSTLKHEIQHAFDDYRSDTKIFKSNAQSKYLTDKKNYESQEVKNKEEFFKINKQYLNLPHEIWARFTQAVGDTRFASSTFGKDSKGENTLITKMKDIHTVVKEFKLSFRGFELLEDDMKKRLIRKIAQFWHLEQEDIKKENS